MSVIFSDNFNRANSDNLGANWNEFSSGAGTTWQILSNQLRGPSDNQPSIIHIAETTTSAHSAIADCRVTFKRVASVGAYDGGPCVRKQSGASTCYYLDVSGTNTFQVYQRVAGVDTAVGSAITSTHANGDTYGLEVTGSGATVTLKVYQNGTLKGTVTDSSAGRITSAGQTGVALWSGSTDIDDFSVDDLTAGGTAPTEEESLVYQISDWW